MYLTIFAEGKSACFTVPAFVSERVSYLIPPPTAVRGLLESILFRPEFRYHIISIALARHSSGNPTSTLSFMANEVGDLRPGNVNDKRQQRRSSILRHPAYLIEFDLRLGSRPITKRGHNLQTYQEMFSRRVEKGQSFGTPHFGLREYPADIRLATPQDEIIDETRALGSYHYIAWSGDNYEAVHTKGMQVVRPDVWMLRGKVDMHDWKQA